MSLRRRGEGTTSGRRCKVREGEGVGRASKAGVYSGKFHCSSLFFPRHTHTVVPHVTDAVQDWVERVARIAVGKDNSRPDVCVIEVISQVVRMLL